MEFVVIADLSEYDSTSVLSFGITNSGVLDLIEYSVAPELDYLTLDVET